MLSLSTLNFHKSMMHTCLLVQNMSHHLSAPLMHVRVMGHFEGSCIENKNIIVQSVWGTLYLVQTAKKYVGSCGRTRS